MKISPSKDYKKTIKSLNLVVRDCMVTSNLCAGIKSETSKHYYASLLFTQICNRSVSMMILAPHSSWAKKKIGSLPCEQWDFSTMAGIVRSILETRIAFFYLCTEQCSLEEWECRWNFFNLHDCKSRMHLFQNIPDNDRDLKGFAEQAKELRDRISTNEFFNNLDIKSDKRNSLLNGKTAYIYPMEEIAERFGVDLQEFRLLYKLFSSHVHCLPMSFYRMKEQNSGRGVHSEYEEGYTLLCLSFAEKILASARDEMKTIFGIK